MKGAVFKRETETVGEGQRGGVGGGGSRTDRRARENRGTDEGIKEKQGGASMDD